MPKKLSKAKKETQRKKNEWKIAVRKQWGNKCAICGKSGEEYSLDTHHTTYRKDLKYNPAIGILLCKFDHKLGHGSAHKEAIIFYRKFKEMYPEEYENMLNLIDSLCQE